MLATNIAGITVQRRGGIDPDSLQMLYNTYIFIKVVAIGGYLPVTFGLLALRMLKKISWYLVALSTATVGLAIGDLHTKHTFSPSQTDLTALQEKSVTGGPVACGGNNPIAWCYNRIGVNGEGFNATNEGDGADYMLVLSLVALGFIIIEHFWKSPDPTNQKLKGFLFRSRNRSSKDEKPMSRWTTVLYWCDRYFAALLFIILIPLYIYCLAVFADDLDWFRVNKTYDPSWTFGQIVAMLVWAPPIVEFFWESFRKCSPKCEHMYYSC